MSLYPSLEDMKVDELMKAQMQYEASQHVEVAQEATPYPNAPPPYPTTGNGHLYPSLGDFMGLQITDEFVQAHIPQQALAVPQPQQMQISQNRGGMIAPLSNQSLAFQKTQVTHGIRELVLCKDADEKIGLRLRSVNNGLFVCLVSKNTPAALAGLKFGDQILQINGEDVAGMDMEEGHKILKKCGKNDIKVIVRDRPFERTVVLHKDSTDHIGFQFSKGKITGLVKDSSAARNGLLTDHQLLEVNGQNVIGLDDKEVTKIIRSSASVVSLTIMPHVLYEHMIKKMHGSLITKLMDHSQPTI
ncbi:syntenin-1-like isoform X2 [Neocloeon triangulifer]|nr:syntenin-1-like isoform X2 [Neocloeon triangulifer]XP_059470611.1 syntenin-1-like isoform X2 [Neocloeon triangulifer]